MAYDINKIRTSSRSRIPADKIVSYITKNFEYKVRKNGEEYVINNPLNSDVGFHFNINPHKGMCHDWRGNEWAGPINPETNKRNCSFVKFIRLYKKCSYAAAIREIMGHSVDVTEYLRPEGRQTDVSAKVKVDIALPTGAEPLSPADDIQSNSLKKWLKSRGYDDESMAKYDLHYIGMDVYWPYYEFDTLVYWQSRSRLNKKFNFPSLEVVGQSGDVIGITEGSKGDFLYGFDEVEPAKYVIITEAIFDQHTLGQQALASGGAILTAKQINKLKIIGPKSGIILSPDNDKAGIKSIVSNFQLLEPYGFNVFYSLPPSLDKNIKDWNEMYTKANLSRKEIRKLHDENIKKIKLETIVQLCNMIK